MLEQRINKLVEALAHAQRELRQQLLDQSKAFLDETQRTRDELFATVTRELGPEGEPPVPGRERGFDEETGAPSHH